MIMTDESKPPLPSSSPPIDHPGNTEDVLANYHAPETEDEVPWVTEEQVAALVMEREFKPAESEEELATRIFREGLPVAAQAIAHLARHSKSEKMRFDAARYVVDRNLGRIVDPTGLKRGEDPLKEFLGMVTTTYSPQLATAHADTSARERERELEVMESEEGPATD